MLNLYPLTLMHCIIYLHTSHTSILVFNQKQVDLHSFISSSTKLIYTIRTHYNRNTKLLHCILLANLHALDPQAWHSHYSIKSLSNNSYNTYNWAILVTINASKLINLSPIHSIHVYDSYIFIITLSYLCTPI